MPSSPVIPVVRQAPGLGLSASARVVGDPAVVKAIFHRDLLDYGVLPVEVTIRNDDVRPLCLHAAASLDPGGLLDGVCLVAESEYPPLHPTAVASCVRGEPSADAYRTLGAGDYTAGMMLAPLGGFYLFREFTIGRYMRPLLNRSLLPPGDRCLFAPLRLEPGESASGFLYFILPGEESPFRTIERTIERDGKTKTRIGREIVPEKTAGWELLFRPARIPDPPEAPAMPLRGVCFLDAGGEILAAVLDSVAGRESSLCLARADGLAAGGVDRRELGRVRSRSARIAAVARGVDWTAVAVDISARSRLFLLRPDGVVATATIPRPVLALAGAPGGLVAVTTNGFAYAIDPVGADASRGRKVGREMQAAVAVGGRLVVIERKEATVFELEGKGIGDPLAHRVLEPVDRRLVGTFGGGILIIHDGRGMAGDTLVVLDDETAAERGRLVLPGRVETAGVDDRRAILRLGTGALLGIALSSAGHPTLATAGFLPADLMAIRPLGDGFVAVSAAGAVFEGRVADLRPGPHTDPSGTPVKTRTAVPVEAVANGEER